MSETRPAFYRDLLNDDQVKSLGKLPKRNLYDLLDCIGQRRKSGANRPHSPPSWKLILSVLVGSLILPNYSPLIWQWGAKLVVGRDNRKCSIPMPFDTKNVFRPPVDCHFCQNIHQVDIVKHITPDEFESPYAYNGRPVIVKNALANWTAMDVFSYEFFHQLYTKDSSSGQRSERCQFFPYKTEFRSLKEALTMSHERRISRPWYFGWSNCDSETADVLRHHYSRPYFLPERSESSRTDWIFMGTAGLGAHMHVDHVGLPSWQAQIRGHKSWFLEPPPECFYQCQSMQVTVEPGDTIVLDTNIWYHRTSVVSEEVSITIGSEYD